MNEMNLWGPGPENHYPNRHLKRWKYLGQCWMDKTLLAKRLLPCTQGHVSQIPQQMGQGWHIGDPGSILPE